MTYRTHCGLAIMWAIVALDSAAAGSFIEAALELAMSLVHVVSATGKMAVD